MNSEIPKSVPYISFSIKKLPAFLKLVRTYEPIGKKKFVTLVAEKFSRSEKTILEFLISLKNLKLLREDYGVIKLTACSKKMLEQEPHFWEILRQELVGNEIIFEIFQAIIFLSKESVGVKSNKEFYNLLACLLKDKYNFKSASPRELDRFITLFRQIKILDYDAFSDEYFVVRMHNVKDEVLEQIVIKSINELKPRMIKETGTAWIPLDNLRSIACRENGLETIIFDKYMKKIIDKNSFSFAEASSSRKEVLKGGIKKNDKIYFYLKIFEE